MMLTRIKFMFGGGSDTNNNKKNTLGDLPDTVQN
jgi:hypothetical protein